MRKKSRGQAVEQRGRQRFRMFSGLFSRNPEAMEKPVRHLLLTGASGYVGGRLLKTLEEQDYSLRCLARQPEFLRPKVRATTDVVQGDVLNPASLQAAMRDIDAAYYLVHSMGSTGAFEEEDRRAAKNFADAAREAGVRRIIYLGGLGKDEALSPHLASRQEVGNILRSAGVPTIELRASIIIGSGSLSFEMIRALVEKLPVMITPRWTNTLAQPIAIEDVIAYLIEDNEFAETRWSDALSSPGELRSWGGVKFGTRIVDSRQVTVKCNRKKAMLPIRRLGGKTGWYFGNWLWKLRGFIDLLIGGVGLRRGRRDPEWPAPGDTLDFWRVEAFEPNRLLRLFAEMKLPGRAWLQFEIEDHEAGATIRQTAIFDPVGIFGLLYWYALYPLHSLIFGGMLRGIARAATTNKS